jgi:hypothetical protein
MRCWPFLAALGLIAMPGAARAATAPCAAAESAPVTIEAVQSALETWEGHCVRLRGLAANRRLYASRDALLDPIIVYGPLPARSIVIYPDGPTRRERDPRMVEIVGRIGSCARMHELVREMRERERDHLIMVAGYCHTSLESYVRPTTIRVTDHRAIPRPTEAEVAPGRRQLIDAPATVPLRNEQAAAARALAAAIAAGDQAAFRRLHDPDLQAEIDRPGGTRTPAMIRAETGEENARLRRLRAPDSVFAGLPAATSRQERVFVTREDQSDAAAPGAHDDVPLLTCWCRSADCTGRWPVRTVDADNDRHRPYACVQTSGRVVFSRHGASTIQAEPPAFQHGFAEPAWPPR